MMTTLENLLLKPKFCKSPRHTLLTQLIYTNFLPPKNKQAIHYGILLGSYKKNHAFLDEEQEAHPLRRFNHRA